MATNTETDDDGLILKLGPSETTSEDALAVTENEEMMIRSVCCTGPTKVKDFDNPALSDLHECCAWCGDPNPAVERVPVSTAQAAYDERYSS